MILSDRIERVGGDAARGARARSRVIRENLAWALVYNVIAIPAAAFGFVTPLVAAVGMSVSSLVVVGNALRLTRPCPSDRRERRAAGRPRRRRRGSPAWKS